MIDEFRLQTRAWLARNCPQGVRGNEVIPIGMTIRADTSASRKWLERLLSKGWTEPTWPKEYGGGGLSDEQHHVLTQELSRIGASNQFVGIAGKVIGSAIIELGTENQKRRHLPGIVKGETAWCQGFSEPEAGSDLASLRTRAEANDDRFVVNGQKIWTSGAHLADWMFALVRTEQRADKREGISMLLIDMHQAGVLVRPIRLLSGKSLFCETHFQNAIARKDDLVGELHNGWNIGRRVLRIERNQVALMSAQSNDSIAGSTLQAEGKKYCGELHGRIADASVRQRIVLLDMNERAYRLTRRRIAEETRIGLGNGVAASLLKLIGTELTQEKSDIRVTMRGSKGLGWSGKGFDAEALNVTRTWLWDRAASIYSGTNEIQRNIIATRELDLPD